MVSYYYIIFNFTDTFSLRPASNRTVTFLSASFRTVLTLSLTDYDFWHNSGSLCAEERNAHRTILLLFTDYTEFCLKVGDMTRDKEENCGLV